MDEIEVQLPVKCAVRMEGSRFQAHVFAAAVNDPLHIASGFRFLKVECFFGKDGCKNLAEQLSLPLLAQLPIVQSVCENGDNGRPAAMDVASPVGQAFLALAQAVASKARLIKE